MTPDLYQSNLSNGIRVISQPTPGHQGATIAIHVASGSRDEGSEIGGAAHFIEHLLFKGTSKRTPHQITSEFDALGVDPNAGTGQDGVTYYFTVLREYLPKAFEILSDMFLNSTFPEKELETERMVILEEITRNNDDHGSFLASQFCSGFWDGHPLGRPVIGFKDTVSTVSREELMGHMQQYYRPDKIIVSAAGNVNHAELVALCQEHLGGVEAAKQDVQSVFTAPELTGMACARHNLRKMEQVQFYLGYPALLATDNHYWDLKILNNILGNGMGSRLFREVREERGLAYSVGSGILGFDESSALIVFAGCDTDHAQEAIDVCHGEVMKLVREKITTELLADSKRQARGRLLIGLDYTCSQASNLADDSAQRGKARSVAEKLDAIEAVTSGKIIEIAERLFSDSLPRLESVGPEVELTLPM